VVPPGAAALLDPTPGPGEESDPDPTDPAVVRATATPLACSLHHGRIRRRFRHDLLGRLHRRGLV
jgi:hypothetical protein